MEPSMFPMRAKLTVQNLPPVAGILRTQIAGVLLGAELAEQDKHWEHNDTGLIVTQVTSRLVAPRLSGYRIDQVLVGYLNEPDFWVPL